MKVYFSASVSQRQGMENAYEEIVKVIKSYGCEVVTSYDVLSCAFSAVKQAGLDRIDFCQDWEAAVSKADVAVMEVSHPSSINVGVELIRLIERGKPVICLYEEGKGPAFVKENLSNRLIALEYKIEELREVISFGLEEAAHLMNRRFTFYISGEIEAFLDKMVKKSGINRSEFIRNLIVERMRVIANQA